LLAYDNKALATEAEAETKAFSVETEAKTNRDQGLQRRDQDHDQDVQSRGRGKIEAFEISTEARLSQGNTAPQDGLDRGVKTEATSPTNKQPKDGQCH